VQVNADAQEAGKQSFGIPVRVVPDCWDVVGLGQAMVSLFLLTLQACRGLWSREFSCKCLAE
jgi:hypothetical protein